MAPVLLNIDAGEDPNEPNELYRLAEIVSIACGGHAGDDETMERALSLAAAGGASAGAHPSYPDRAGFGRRAQAIAPADLEEIVRGQCARLMAHATRLKVALAYMKPHGALYHAANQDPELAHAVVHGAHAALGDFTLIGPAPSLGGGAEHVGGGALAEAARDAKIGFLREGFADRGVRADGTLVPRDEAGALIADPAHAAQNARVLAASGTVDTVCVHGDTPGAIAIARAVRSALHEARA